MLYELMNKDVVVATYREEEGIDDFAYQLVKASDAYLPYFYRDINA